MSGEFNKKQRNDEWGEWSGKQWSGSTWGSTWSGSTWGSTWSGSTWGSAQDAGRAGGRPRGKRGGRVPLALTPRFGSSYATDDHSDELMVLDGEVETMPGGDGKSLSSMVQEELLGGAPAALSQAVVPFLGVPSPTGPGPDRGTPSSSSTVALAPALIPLPWVEACAPNVNVAPSGHVIGQVYFSQTQNQRPYMVTASGAVYYLA